MPETREITVYTFDELSDEIGNRAFIGSCSPKTRASNTISEWLQEDANRDLEEFVFARVLEEYGFPTDKIEWSLGHSQGDGMAFYGEVDVRTFLKKIGKLSKFTLLLAADPYARIEKNDYGYHYSHYNTMTVGVSFYGNETDKRNTAVDTLEELLSATVKEVSRRLEREGYEHLEVSEDQIRDTCEANDYRFNADGTLAR